MAARHVAMPEMPVQARLLRGRGGRLPRSRLEALEAAGYDPHSAELLVALVWLVLGELPISEAELNASRRRAMFVLAAGGDPHRELDLSSVAADRLAAELDSPERRKALRTALSALDACGPPRRLRGPRRRSSTSLSSPGAASASPCSRTSSRTNSMRAYTGRRRRPTCRRRRSHLPSRSPAQAQAPALPLRQPPAPAVLARRRAVLPQPRLLRPHRRPRRARRDRALPARAPRVVDPDPPRACVHRARERPVVPHGRPDRPARPDRRPQGAPARRHDRPRGRRRRRRRARRVRLEGLAADGRRPRLPAQARRSSRTCRSRRSSRASAARSSARRSRRPSSSRTRRRRSTGYLDERAASYPRLHRHVPAVAQLPAGRPRQHVPRAARRSEPVDARHDALRACATRRDRRHRPASRRPTTGS